MCYSAEASFVASGALAGCSVAIARLPKEKASVPLSLFPALFAAHQFAEGIVWLGKDGVLPEAFKWGAIYVYVFIAFVLWPVLVPFSAYLLEKGRRRRIITMICLAVGLGVGLTLLLSILRGPVGVLADCCHISYQVVANELLIFPYLIAVSVPFLASSRRSLVLFGLGIAASCAAAWYLSSATALPSVWYFFAAILSGGLYLHFRAETRVTAHQPKASEKMGVVPN